MALRSAKCHPACCKSLLWSRRYVLCAPQGGGKAPRVVGNFSNTSVRRDTLLTLCRSVLKLRLLMETDFSTQKLCEVCNCPRNTQIFAFYVTQNTLRPHCKNRSVNPLKPELNPICYLLALLAHHFLHVSRIRVKSLTLR